MIASTSRIVSVAVLIAQCTMAQGAPANEPRIDYLLHCGGCHGMEGHGAPPIVPSLHSASGLLARVPAGREYLIRVPGSSQSRLDNAALARVLTWMLESFSADTLPDDFRPYSEREVARGRMHVLKDPLRRRAEIAAMQTTSQPEI